MDQISRNDVQALLEDGGEHCVSIYLPTHPTWPQRKPDKAAFANHVTRAQQQLEQQGMRPAAARTLLEPLRAVEDDPGLWRHRSLGLAAFATEGHARHYCVGQTLDELLVVGPSFAVRPLLALASGAPRFVILALSEHDVRLIRCDGDSAVEVELPPHPRSVSEATGYDEPERGFTVHAGDRTGQTGHAAMVSTMGIRANDRKDDILEYCRAIDTRLRPVLRNETAPLVLAGVEFVLRIYREANTFPHLIAAELPGATGRRSADELRRAALPLVEPVLGQERERAARRYREHVGSGSATSDPTQIVTAARDGVIAALFLRRGAHCWGRFDMERRRIEEHPQQQPGDEDLFDMAAVHALRHGAAVYELDAADMPDAAPAAAVMRY